MTATAPAPFRFTLEHVHTKGQPPHDAFIYKEVFLRAIMETGSSVLICDTYGDWHYAKISWTQFARKRTDVMFIYPPDGEAFPVFVEG